MPNYTITVKERPKIGSPAFTADQMRHFGERADEIMKARLAEGRDVFDAAAKPLSERYKRRKIAKGRPPVRDLRLTGNLLGSMGVIDASPDAVTVSIRGSTPYRKGLYNQNIDPWFGLSPHDETQLMSDVEEVFGRNVRDLQK